MLVLTKKTKQFGGFGRQIIAPAIARDLKEMMSATINYGTAKHINFGGGVKTGTADSGHLWITGFFPKNNPEYAITILVEDGKGNNPGIILDEILKILLR